MAAETYDTRALQLLSVRIAEETMRETEALALGSPTSFEDYRERVGVIRGMRKVAEMFKDVERDLYGGKS